MKLVHGFEHGIACYEASLSLPADFAGPFTIDQRVEWARKGIEVHPNLEYDSMIILIDEKAEMTMDEFVETLESETGVIIA